MMEYSKKGMKNTKGSKPMAGYSNGRTNDGMRKCGKGGNTTATNGGKMHTSTPNPKQS